MNFVVLTIFPELMDSFWAHGIVRRAVASGSISAASMDIRAFSPGRHKEVDDRPYGGGNGMVMSPEPLTAAIREARKRLPRAQTVLFSPRGHAFSQKTAQHLADKEEDLILVCGRYEGVDERVCAEEIDLELSIGDFVLTGGEVAAMAVVETVIRLLPGVLGGEDSAEKESFQNGRLEHAHYTRPAIFENREVPAVLLSGNHAEIEKWRRTDSLKRTLLNRPDLLAEEPLSSEEKNILKNWCRQIESLIGR